MCVPCLSDLNSTEFLSFWLPVPSELKSTLAKMLMLLSGTPICCLEGLWLAIATKVVSALTCTSTYSEQKGEKTDTPETAPQLSEQQLQYRTTQDPRLWSAAQQSYNLELEYFPMHYDTK